MSDTEFEARIEPSEAARVYLRMMEQVESGEIVLVDGLGYVSRQMLDMIRQWQGWR